MFSFANRLKEGLSNQVQSIGSTASSATASHFVGLEINSVAIVTRAIEPGRTGQVKFQGSWWTARCNSGAMLLAGETVQVLYRQNLTVYVEPLSFPTMALQQAALSSY